MGARKYAAPLSPRNLHSSPASLNSWVLHCSDWVLLRPAALGCQPAAVGLALSELLHPKAPAPNVVRWWEKKRAPGQN